MFERLSRRFRVIAVDHRGHGRGIRSRRRFRLADCADDAVAVADQLGVERFVAVGHSMGGPIAQLVWKRHPELFSDVLERACRLVADPARHDSPALASL